MTCTASLEDYRRDEQASLNRRVLFKATLNDKGEWVSVPHILTRDAKGWHDKPATPLMEKPE